MAVLDGLRPSAGPVRRWLKRLAGWLPAPPSTNYLYRDIRPGFYELLGPGAVIYDIGSKDARGRYAFGSPPDGTKVVCVDIAPGPGVDVVADAQDMRRVADGAADGVLLVSMLQHVPNPHRVAAEVHRILKPGGVLYASAPFIWSYHRDPDDYWRFSRRGLEELFSRFEKVDSGFNRGPASTFCDLLVRFCAILFCCNSHALYSALVYLFKWTFFWIKYLDAVIARYDVAYVLHNAPYFIGRKRPRPAE